MNATTALSVRDLHAGSFTYAYYRQLIETILANGYACASFACESCPNEPRVFLRHDIDFDPWGALELGKIEHSLGVSSVFFVQPNADAYNSLAPDCVAIINQLAEMGHEVGLHIDAAVFESESALAHEICVGHEYFSRFMPLSRIVSFHRPASFLLESDVALSGFTHVYEKRFFKDIAYVSDSNRREFWREPIMEGTISEKRSLQLLTHPVWWAPFHQSVWDVATNYRLRYLRYLDHALAVNARCFSEIASWMH